MSMIYGVGLFGSLLERELTQGWGLLSKTRSFGTSM